MSTGPFAAVMERDLVVVRGPDATSFLQSLVSQDLDAVPVGASAHALLLQPQGKLIVDFNALHRVDDEWWCLVESGFGAALADGLGRFKIRVDVEIEMRALSVFAVRDQVPPDDTHGADVVGVSWNGRPAYDALAFDALVLDKLRDAIDVPLVSTAEYERARIEAGVPRMGADLDERTIPQEAGLERDAVSFTKGCFVGQELVCRIDTRGHVNRNLRRLRTANETLLPGVEITFEGRTVGSVTSAAGSVALAMVRREVEPGAVVDANGVHARVEATF